MTVPVELSDRMVVLTQATQHKGLTTEEREVAEIKRIRDEARTLREKNARAVQRQATNKNAIISGKTNANPGRAPLTAIN